MKVKKFISGIIASVVTLTAGVIPQVISVSAEEVPEGFTPIHNIEELYAINSENDGNYILMNDIDMTEDTAPGGDWDINGKGWKPISNFNGIFDGNGHAIIGMNVHGNVKDEYDIGLFNYGHGDIINLKMLDVDINVTYNEEDFVPFKSLFHIGTVYGYAEYGTINNCFSNGEIVVEYKGGDYSDCEIIVGGIAGSNYTDTLNCYSSTNIKLTGKNMSYNVGGIVGNGNRIRYCYNTGKIFYDSESVFSNKNAICGSNNEHTCIDCYYLNGTCEEQESVSGECMGLSVAQMKSQAAFINWDFNDTWIIDSTSSYKYPQLRSCMQIPVTSVNLISAPTKEIYSKGDTLNLAGGKISVYHQSDETTGELAITQNMLSDYNMEQIGKQKISVTYVDKSTEFEITVNPLPVKNLIVSELTEEYASISWDKVSGVSGYYIYKRETEEEEWKQCGKVKAAEFTDTEENLNTDFMYAVSAYLTIDNNDYISDKVIVKKPLDFTLAEITIDDIIYNGEPHKVIPQVIYNGKELKEGKDFNITDGDFQVDKTGDYTLTLSGTGDYAGSVTIEFKVICTHELEHETWGKCLICGEIPNIIDISDATVSANDIKVNYYTSENGIDIEETVTYKGVILKRNVDYIFPDANGDKVYVGEYTFKIEGIGCFTGENTGSFNVECEHYFGNEDYGTCKICGYVNYCRGDISGNGKIDLYDAIIIAQYLLRAIDIDSTQILIADFDNDGRITLYDAIGIAKYILTHNK